MSKLIFAFLFVYTISTQAQEPAVQQGQQGPEPAGFPIELQYENPEDKGTTYEQFKALYDAATEVPTADDFERKVKNPKRICYDVDKGGSQIPEFVTVFKYPETNAVLQDANGVILPEREIVKVLVGPNLHESQKPSWFEIIVEDQQLVSIYSPAEQTEIRTKYSFRKSGDRLLYKATGKAPASIVDAYGVCFVSVLSNQVLLGQ